MPLCNNNFIQKKKSEIQPQTHTTITAIADLQNENTPWLCLTTMIMHMLLHISETLPGLTFHQWWIYDYIISGCPSVHAQPTQDYSNGYYSQWIIMHQDNSGLVVHGFPRPFPLGLRNVMWNEWNWIHQMLHISLVVTAPATFIRVYIM